MRNLLWVMLSGAVAVGCGPSSVLNQWERPEINDANSLRRWSGGSAPQIYSSLTLTLGAWTSAAEDSSESGCPARRADGDVTTFTGGCTDGDGLEWTGKLTITGDSDEQEGFGNLRFEDFGFSGTVACGSEESAPERLLIAGTFLSEPTDDPAVGRFSYDLRIEQSLVNREDCAIGGDIIAYSYSGTREESGSRVTWNGSGKFGQESLGAADVRTEDEVLDSSECSTEALSGTTTLSSSEGEVVITYDGASDCSDEATVTWTLNGEAMGTVAGISCATAPGGPLWLALSGLLLAGLGRLRRRRR